MVHIILQKVRAVLRGIGAIVCLALLGLVVWMLLSWFALIPVHELNLWLLKRNFKEVAHPYQSTLLARMAEFGNFGNSNHCDYLVGEFRSSSLSAEEIKRAYEGIQVRSFSAGAKLPIEIYFADNLREAAAHDYNWNERVEKYLSENLRDFDGDGKNIYFVSVSSDMNPPVGDFRCH